MAYHAGNVLSRRFCDYITLVNMNVDATLRFLRSRALWALIGGVLVVYALAYTFVRVKTTDCELQCGEDFIGKATYRVEGGFSRTATKPMTGSCDCGLKQPSGASR